MMVVRAPNSIPITMDCGVIANGKPANDPMAKETLTPRVMPMRLLTMPRTHQIEGCTQIRQARTTIENSFADMGNIVIEQVDQDSFLVVQAIVKLPAAAGSVSRS